MILTLTTPDDHHAIYVQEALRHKGGDTQLWYTADLAQLQDASVEIDGEATRWRVSGADLDFGPVAPEVIWFRRPARPVLSDAVHPADRKWANREHEEFFRWLIEFLPADVFQVNSPERARRANSKIYQLQAAQRVGLRFPQTLYSNDTRKIRAFLRHHGGQAVYKSITQQGPWLLSDQSYAVLYTSLLTEDGLPDDEVLKATPGIFQQLLQKAFELRVTVIGKRVFPAKIDSQATRKGQLDWRRALDDMTWEETDIPAELSRTILKLMEEMGLAFGCLDFVVTPEGEYVFLEVNEMGQFLFVEHEAGTPLLDAFCEMLLQGKTDYRWDPARVTVRMHDLKSRVESRLEEAMAEHVQPPPPLAGEDPADTASA